MTPTRAQLAGDVVELLVGPEDRGQLVRRLREADPPLRSRRTADGVSLPIAEAVRLADLALVDLDWDDAAATAVHNRQALASAAPTVLAEARRISKGGAAAARAAVADWSCPVALDDHQLIDVAVMTLPEGWGACVFDEQGTGKTVTTLAAFDLLVERGEADTLVLVAPKSMVAEWHAEFARFLSDVYSVVVVDGPRGRRSELLHSGADVFVMGYETAASHELELLMLGERRRTVLVVDESFNIKNPDARRADALRAIRERCRRCFVLCGTPAPNRPRDLVAQFDLVDFGHTFAGLRLDDDREVERLAVDRLLSARGLYTRNLKSVVLPYLPTRSFVEVEVELEPVQRRAYDAAVEDLIVDLESIGEERYRREILSFLERKLALLRICSNPFELLPGYDETPAKLLALDSILLDGARAKEKLVIWSYFRASVVAIAERYAHLGCVVIDGSVAPPQRREAVRRFQEDADVRIFVGNPAAAGAGITLHRAHTAVYESIGNRAADWMQSLDRIHRRGQEHAVDYLLLVSQDTIEGEEYRRLREKADAQATLLGDDVRHVPTRRQLLAELVGT